MEVDSAVEAIGFGRYQIKNLAVFFVLQMADGCEVLLIAFLGTLIRCEWYIDALSMATLTTSVFVGMFFGALTLGNLADRYGRRSVLNIVCYIVISGSVLSAFVPTFAWLCLYRCQAGFGIAGFLVINSSLMCEVAPRDYRAFCQAVIFTGWGFGSVLIVGIGYAIIPTLGWRWFLLAASVPIVIGSLGLFFIDESPRYLLASDQQDAAFGIIRKMAECNRKELPCKELKNTAGHEQDERASFKVFLTSDFPCTILLTCFMAFVAGFCYYGAVFLSAQLPLINYDCWQGHMAWKEPPMRDDSCCPQLTDDTYVSMVIAASGDLFAGVIMNVLIDRFGRKKGMIICLCTSAPLFLAPSFCMPGRLRDVSLFFLRCFTLTFSQSLVVYMMEVFPTTIRSTAVGCCSLSKRVGGMLTPYFAQMLLETHTKISLILYAALCVLSLALLIFFGEETERYELFENMNHFSRRNSGVSSETPLINHTKSK